MKDGVYRYMKKIGDFFIVIAKKYKSSCYLDIQAMNEKNQPVIIRQIYNFDNPISMSEEDFKKKYDNQSPLLLDE